MPDYARIAQKRVLALIDVIVGATDARRRDVNKNPPIRGPIWARSFNQRKLARSKASAAEHRLDHPSASLRFRVFMIKNTRQLLVTL